MNIKQICSQASATINRSELDLLLAKALNKPKAYLYAHPEYSLNSTELNLFNILLNRYQKSEPLAYILEETEFYGLSFFINPSVLIPRPETEILVKFILEKFPQKNLTVLELGTGSGVIAISLAKHRPDWIITAADISEEALKLAQSNAVHHEISQNLNFINSNWYQNLPPLGYDLIISNPPYIAETDPHLKALTAEPSLALVAGKEGMDAIEEIMQGAQAYLNPEGCMILEHGYDQAERVQQCYKANGFKAIQTMKDLSHHDRITFARKS